MPLQVLNTSGMTNAQAKRFMRFFQQRLFVRQRQFLHQFGMLYKMVPDMEYWRVFFHHRMPLQEYANMLAALHQVTDVKLAPTSFEYRPLYSDYDPIVDKFYVSDDEFTFPESSFYDAEFGWANYKVYRNGSNTLVYELLKPEETQQDVEEKQEKESVTSKRARKAQAEQWKQVMSRYKQYLSVPAVFGNIIAQYIVKVLGKHIHRFFKQPFVMLQDEKRNQTYASSIQQLKHALQKFAIKLIRECMAGTSSNVKLNFNKQLFLVQLRQTFLAYPDDTLWDQIMFSLQNPQAHAKLQSERQEFLMFNISNSKANVFDYKMVLASIVIQVIEQYQVQDVTSAQPQKVSVKSVASAANTNVGVSVAIATQAPQQLEARMMEFIRSKSNAVNSQLTRANVKDFVRSELEYITKHKQYV